MGEIREEVATLHIEICFLIENKILSISVFIPLFVHLSLLHKPRHFDLLAEDEKIILIVGTKRNREEVLLDPDFLYDLVLKRVTHESIFVDR